MKKISRLILACSLVILLTLSGCGRGSLRNLTKRGFSSNAYGSHISAEFQYMDGDLDRNLGKLQKGDKIQITYQLDASSGELAISIYNHSYQKVAQASETAGVLEYEVAADGDYKLVISAKQAQGSFTADWQN